MQSERGQQLGQLLDFDEVGQRRRGEGGAAASHNENGNLRARDIVKERVLAPAEATVLGEHLHEIESLKVQRGLDCLVVHLLHTIRFA